VNPNGASFGEGFAIPPLGRWFGEGLQTGEWRMADGGGQMADGGGRADDEYEVSLGGCAAGNSSQPMAQAYPDVTAKKGSKRRFERNRSAVGKTANSLVSPHGGGLGPFLAA